MNKKNFPSLESLEEEGGFDAGAEVMFDHTDEVDGYEYEVTAMLDGRDQENYVEVIDGAETDIASLESLLSAIDEARDVGMEAYSAQFANIQIGAIQKRYGVDALETAFPSMECFQGRQARLAASVSMESVKETISKIFAWLREKIKQFIEACRHYWQRLTRSLEFVNREAESIKKHAQKSHWSGGKTISLPPTLAAKLSVNGQVPQGAALVDALRKFKDLNKISADTLDLIYKRITAQWESHLTQGTPKPYHEEVAIPAGWTELHHKDKDDRFSNGTAKTFTSPTLPGNVEICITVYGEANQAAARDRETGQLMRAKPYVQKNPVENLNTEVSALSASEVIGLCNEIQSLVASLQANRRELDQHLYKAKRAIDQIGDRYTRIQWGEAAIATTQLIAREITKTIYANGVVYGPGLSKACEEVAFGALTAALAYARHSAKAYANQEQGRLALAAPVAA